MTSALSKQLTGVLQYIFQQTTKLLRCKFLFYCFHKARSKRQTPRSTVTFSRRRAIPHITYQACFCFGNNSICNFQWLLPASWSSGQSLWLLIMRSRVRFPGSTVGIFPEGEDSRSDHGLGRLVEFRFKGPPGTTSSYITTHIIGTT